MINESEDEARRSEEPRNENLALWEKMIKGLFPKEVPQIAQWEKKEEILNVLQQVAVTGTWNHTFFPMGGGLDFMGVEVGSEPDTLLLHVQCSILVKPLKLYFCSFDEHWEWAYFRLETGGLSASDVYEDLLPNATYEELTEIAPGRYVPRSAYDQGWFQRDENGNELPLPKGARSLTRVFKGSFVIFAKRSLYNLAKSPSDAYDGRHNKMSADAFRQYVLDAIAGGRVYRTP